MRNERSPEIRKASSSDWATIRDICCRTGAAGAPIAPERWPFFGELWVGPYQKLLPDWAYVATDKERVQAYLTGCPDTRSFRRKRFVCCDLPLVAKVALNTYRLNTDTKRFLRRTFRMETGPEERFSAQTWEAIHKDYPAHLHINADADFRGKGVGRTLIERFARDLHPLGSAGIHVFCGVKPVPFYERLGFREIEKIEFIPGVWVYCLGLKLN